jgi:hypothetical protein
VNASASTAPPLTRISAGSWVPSGASLISKYQGIAVFAIFLAVSDILPDFSKEISTMEAAASLTGLIVFTGQTLKLAAQIHGFLTTIINAPAEIRQLSQNLNGLNNVLSEILDAARGAGNFDVVVPRTLESTLVEIRGDLEGLERVVQKTQGVGRVERSWKKLKWAFAEKDVERMCSLLERRKQTLSLAVGTVNL